MPSRTGSKNYTCVCVNLLHRYLDGSYCYDEICCEFGKEYQGNRGGREGHAYTFSTVTQGTIHCWGNILLLFVCIKLLPQN